jgi:hypothetical protein
MVPFIYAIAHKAQIFVCMMITCSEKTHHFYESALILIKEQCFSGKRRVFQRRELLKTWKAQNFLRKHEDF